LDAVPNDDDGITQVPRSTAGAEASVELSASAAGFVDAWRDINGNGVFDHPAEHIGEGSSVAVDAGSNTLTFTIPGDAAAGATYARIRISSTGGLGPGGAAIDGEVED